MRHQSLCKIVQKPFSFSGVHSRATQKELDTPYKTTKFWSATSIHNKANHAIRIKCIIYLILRVCPRIYNSVGYVCATKLNFTNS